MKKKLILAALLMSMAVTVFAEEQIVWEDQTAAEDPAFVFEEEDTSEQQMVSEEQTASEEPEYVFEEPAATIEEQITDTDTVFEEIAFDEGTDLIQEPSVFEEQVTEDLVSEDLASEQASAVDIPHAVEGLEAMLGGIVHLRLLQIPLVVRIVASNEFHGGLSIGCTGRCCFVHVFPASFRRSKLELTLFGSSEVVGIAEEESIERVFVHLHEAPTCGITNEVEVVVGRNLTLHLCHSDLTGQQVHLYLIKMIFGDDELYVGFFVAGTQNQTAVAVVVV